MLMACYADGGAAIKVVEPFRISRTPYKYWKSQPEEELLSGSFGVLLLTMPCSSTSRRQRRAEHERHTAHGASAAYK
jgi:hypothetical protein